MPQMFEVAEGSEESPPHEAHTREKSMKFNWKTLKSFLRPTHYAAAPASFDSDGQDKVAPCRAKGKRYTRVTSEVTCVKCAQWLRGLVHISMELQGLHQRNQTGSRHSPSVVHLNSKSPDPEDWPTPLCGYDDMIYETYKTTNNHQQVTCRECLKLLHNQQGLPTATVHLWGHAII